MKKLPSSLVKYKTTAVFNEKTVPKALLSEHSTKRNVWGRIVIKKGEIDYTIESNPPEVICLNTEESGVIEPNVLHFIKPLGKVNFFLEFYK
jgi:tellurite resistance-related uncharacterized protein